MLTGITAPGGVRRWQHALRARMCAEANRRGPLVTVSGSLYLGDERGGRAPVLYGGPVCDGRRSVRASRPENRVPPSLTLTRENKSARQLTRACFRFALHWGRALVNNELARQRAPTAPVLRRAVLRGGSSSECRPAY